MSVHEIAIGLAWITSVLKSDSQWLALSPGGVKRGSAPVGTPMPCTLIAFQSGVDVIYANAVRSSVDALYQIKAVGVSSLPDGNTQAIFDLASRIDALFARTRGTTTSAIILSCYRQSPIQYDDDTAGVQYAHIGGLYRVRTQQIPS